jgi:peptidoglycan-N-acetylglucosamine deacetylase
LIIVRYVNMPPAPVTAGPRYQLFIKIHPLSGLLNLKKFPILRWIMQTGAVRKLKTVHRRSDRIRKMGNRTWIIAGTFLGMALLSAGLWKFTKSRTHQVFGGIVTRVETEEKALALTFDDGPSVNTGRILEILDSLEVKATFFVTGRELEEHMEEGRKLAQGGHELGNHSYSHRRMIFRSGRFIREEIERTNTLIREAGYQGRIAFRPPYFKKLVTLPHYLKKSGTKTILCNIEPETHLGYSASAEALSTYVVANAAPGSIILLHIMYESRKEALASLPALVSPLKEQGYRFVTVSELLALDKGNKFKPDRE